MKIGNAIVEKMISYGDRDRKVIIPISSSSSSISSSDSEIELKIKRTELRNRLINITNDQCTKEELNKWVSSKSLKELEELENDSELLFDEVWDIVSSSVCGQIADAVLKEVNLEAMMQHSFTLSDDDKAKLSSLIKGYISEALKEDNVPDKCINIITKDAVSAIFNKIDKSSTASDDEIIDVEYEDKIQFDDSNLIEVTIENDTIDGFLVNAKGHIFGIDHEDLLSLNNKSYISNRCFEYHTRDIQKSEVAKLKENKWFQKLMGTLEPSLDVRLDVVPKGNNIFDLRFYHNHNGNGIFDITFDLGTFITSEIKITLPTEKGLVGIPVGTDNRLLTNLLNYKYTLEDLLKMNCLTKNVLDLSTHLDLTQAPAHALNKIVENIYSNKKLLEKVSNNFWVFDKKEKIAANHFVISSIRNGGRIEKVTYNKGRVTSKLDV